MTKINSILDVDSYKFSHFKMLPLEVKYISSYIEPRWSKAKHEKVMFFGLQMFLKEYLSKPITKEDIIEAKELMYLHGEPFNEEGWNHILNKHGGYLPIKIQALKEGTITNLGVPQVQVRNTDEKVPWLTSFVETALLRAVWYPSTVASNSWHLKQLVKKYLEETSDNVDVVLPFAIHDFGNRGTTSQEASGIGGVSHLVNFMGTDTVNALVYARKYYDEKIAGFSIPASEHSVTCSWGKEREKDFYENNIGQFGDGLIAQVSDTYDLFNALENIFGNQLYDQISNMKGRLIVRPDSGDPLTIPLQTIEVLGNKFGYTLNQKGYKILPNFIRAIQGDGITEETIPLILGSLKNAGWSTENLALGCGAGLLQKVDRDTYGYSMKASAISENAKDWVSIQKTPKTDMNKKSKAGIQKIVDRFGTYVAVSPEAIMEPDMFVDVFENGEIKKEYTLNEIRENSDKVH